MTRVHFSSADPLLFLLHDAAPSKLCFRWVGTFKGPIYGILLYVIFQHHFIVQYGNHTLCMNADILMQYSNGKSALVFCSTRKGAQEVAQRLTQMAMTFGYSGPFIKNKGQHERLREATLCSSDKQMQSYIPYGGKFGLILLNTMEIMQSFTEVYDCQLQLLITTEVLHWRIATLLRDFFLGVIFKSCAPPILLLMGSTYQLTPWLSNQHGISMCTFFTTV